MIIIISVCKERLHYFEFVKPIEDILRNEKKDFFTRHYTKIKKGDFANVDKIIICGTSLKDNGFLKDIKKFKWLKTFNKPILGICAGMQIIGLIYGGKIKSKTEIGFFSEVFKNSFLGLEGNPEVYHLHNNFIDFKKLKDFELFAEGNEIVQAVKHKEKEIYGVLFHPEVRQKDLIKQFVSLK